MKQTSVTLHYFDVRIVGLEYTSFEKTTFETGHPSYYKRAINFISIKYIHMQFSQNGAIPETQKVEVGNVDATVFC